MIWLAQHEVILESNLYGRLYNICVCVWNYPVVSSQGNLKIIEVHHCIYILIRLVQI